MKSIVLAMIAAMSLKAQANINCSSEVKLEGEKYLGCTTNVDGHVESNNTGITQIGCVTFCDSLVTAGSKVIKQSVEISADSSAIAAMSCEAKPKKDKDGNYRGCDLMVNGNTHTASQKDLTSEGCSDFCRAMKSHRDKSFTGTKTEKKVKVHKTTSEAR